MSISCKRLLACFLVLLAAGVSAAPAAEPITRVVVQFRSGAQASPGLATKAATAATAANVNVTLARAALSKAAVLVLASPIAPEDWSAAALRIRQADPSIQSVEPDVRVRALQEFPKFPADPHAGLQWHMSWWPYVGGTRLFDAWPLAGNTKVPVAVVDSGSRPHADMTPNEVPGYDFVSDDVMGADETPGRDSDPTDPGDFCNESRSMWHGLSVASQIGAVANNGIGIAGGAAQNVQIQHVRVLGRCGGWLSDVADGVLWAVGEQLVGVPTNTTPARLVNLSLAAVGLPCPSYMQAAVDAASRRNAIIVAAAGNDASTVLGAPASCQNVIVVGAHTASGDLAYYSNHGKDVTLTAPGGGGCITPLALHNCSSAGTYALGNDGWTTPGENLDEVSFGGTSAAAPHVTATLALMVAVRPSLTFEEAKAALTQGAQPHPSSSFCTRYAGECGAGMLDAYSSVQRLGRMSMAVYKPESVWYVRPGSPVTLKAVVLAGIAPYSLRWTQTAGTATQLANPDAAETTFTAPQKRNGVLGFRVDGSDSLAHSTSADVQLTVNSLPYLKSGNRLTMGAGRVEMRLGLQDDDGDPVDAVLVIGPTGVHLEGDRFIWDDAWAGEQQAIIRLSDGREEVEVAVALVVGSGGSAGGGWTSISALLGLVALLAALTVIRLRNRRGKRSSDRVH